MKRYFNIWGLILVSGLLVISGSSFSQETKMSSQEKKEARKAKLAENFNTLGLILQNRDVVLKADYLDNRYGDLVPVSSITNFILVEADRGVLQTSFNNSVGYNGVGGVTAEGIIGSWEVVKNTKKMTYNVKFSLTTDIGIYDVFMTVNSDFRADARITGLTRGEIRYNGYLSPASESRVFKGRNTL